MEELIQERGPLNTTSKASGGGPPDGPGGGTGPASEWYIPIQAANTSQEEQVVQSEHHHQEEALQAYLMPAEVHSDPWANSIGQQSRRSSSVRSSPRPPTYPESAAFIGLATDSRIHGMTSLHSLSQLGEAMLKDIGLHKCWTVPDPGMIHGFKALHPRELA